VEKGDPAERAGIESGDVILKLNGQPLKDSSELPVQIAAVAPGTSVNLEIWRNHAARESRSNSVRWRSSAPPRTPVRTRKAASWTCGASAHRR